MKWTRGATSEKFYTFHSTLNFIFLQTHRSELCYLKEVQRLAYLKESLWYECFLLLLRLPQTSNSTISPHFLWTLAKRRSVKTWSTKNLPGETQKVGPLGWISEKNRKKMTMIKPYFRLITKKRYTAVFSIEWVRNDWSKNRQVVFDWDVGRIQASIFQYDSSNCSFL